MSIPTISTTKTDVTHDVPFTKRAGRFLNSVLGFASKGLGLDSDAWNIQIKLAELKLLGMQVENNTLDFMNYQNNVKNTLINNRNLTQNSLKNAKDYEFQKFLVKFVLGKYSDKDISNFRTFYGISTLSNEDAKKVIDEVRNDILKKDFSNALLKLLSGTFDQSNDSELIKKIFNNGKDTGTVKADDLNQLFVIIDSEGNHTTITRLIWELFQNLGWKIIK